MYDTLEGLEGILPRILCIGNHFWCMLKEILLFFLADTPPQKKIKLEGSGPATPSNTPRGSVSGASGGVGVVPGQVAAGEVPHQQPSAAAANASVATPVSQQQGVGMACSNASLVKVSQVVEHGLPLIIQPPLGPVKVSFLEWWPHFRGGFVLYSGLPLIIQPPLGPF